MLQQVGHLGVAEDPVNRGKGAPLVGHGEEGAGGFRSLSGGVGAGRLVWPFGFAWESGTARRESAAAALSGACRSGTTSVPPASAATPVTFRSLRRVIAYFAPGVHGRATRTTRRSASGG